MNSIAPFMILANIGLAAFAAAAPAGSLPWWVIAGAAALNAVTHALPNTSLPQALKGMFHVR